MSLAVQATRSAAWMFVAGLATKVLGLVGTLLVVRYVSPGEYGEAVAAAIVIGSASTFSSFGIGPFVVVKSRGRRDLAFHATVFQLALGLVAVGLVLAFGTTLAGWFNTPGLHRYLPLMALSMLIDRLWFVPERVLVREMRFRTVAMSRSVGESAYTVVSLATAVLGWGGMAIVAGNLARSSIKAAVTIAAVDRRDWLEACALRRDATLAMVKFGAPLSVASVAAYAATKWDNLVVSHFFGPAVMAAYNLAYNLSGTASGLVTDHVVDVLVPSFTRVEGPRRQEGLLRSATLLALVATPVCIGLSAVSHTLVSTLFSTRWAAVAPMLAVLSVSAALEPLMALLLTFLAASDRTKSMMIVHVFALVAILVGLVTIGRVDPLWACVAVGIAAFLSILLAANFVRSVDRVPVRRVLSTQLGPLLACVPMVGAVLGVRWLLSTAGSDVRFLGLVAEVVAGALVYVVAVFVVARPAARELLRLLQAAFLKRAALAGPG